MDYFEKELEKAIGWAEYLGLPKIFAKMATTSPRASPTIPTLPKARVFKEEPARTPTSAEVRALEIPIVRVEPKPLITGGIGTVEPSQMAPLRCQQPVDSGIWQPQKVVEKPGILLQK